ncbi:MAG: hypothetical protein MUC43_05150 [Pirellula sp.]|jgi:hypothetical protein|nr:hypothetical protein [Pirellula sp.]
MRHIEFHIRRYLISIVRQLCLVVLGFALFAMSPVTCRSLEAQETSRVSEPIKANPVRPIQRSTATYQKGTRKSAAVSAPRVDWTTLPSTYTHAPDGQRVDQFVTVTPEPVFEIPPHAKSGYRHTRSTLQAGFSSDNYHSVEQWGAPVRPYGEWRYPNRPFSVPYGVWGPQLPQVVGGGFGVFPGVFPGGPQPFPPGNNNGAGLGGQMPPGNPWMQQQWGGPVFGVGPQNVLTPTQDDYYQQAPMLQGPNYHPLRNGLE